MDLILIRHGQSQWNYDQTGGMDAPLTAKGREQARRAGIYCRTQFHFRAMYATPLQRARDTAEIINSYLNLGPIQCIDDLREFEIDYWEGMAQFDSPVEALGVTTLVPPTHVTPEYAAFAERVKRGLLGILSAHADLYETDAQIALVSHGGTMGTIMRMLTASHHYSMTTENTGIYILRWEDRRWHILAMNRTEHLECERWMHEPGKDA
jgi:broad specificity phosphatase PhoE